MCVYSNSRNDVPQVAQRYGTIAAHTRRRASILVVFCVHMYSFAGSIRRTPPPTFSDTAITDRHSDTTDFQLRAHWVRISWSIGSEKLFGRAPGGSRTLDFLRARRASYPLGQALRFDNDIDVYSENINTTINSIANECIPNRHIRVKPTDPPWITTFLKRYIRKRKRAFRKAMRTNMESHWKTFKKLRNEVTTMIRDSKTTFHDKLADKLKSNTISTKDWWSTLKTFINPNSGSSIPPLEHDNNIYTDESDKANRLNMFFQSQTIVGWLIVLALTVL